MTVRRIPTPYRSPRAATPRLLHVLDGAHPWGTASSSVSRYGTVHERITVLPPGTTIARRRWVSATHAMPCLALLSTLAAGGIGAGLDVPWSIAFGFPAAIGAVAWLVCWWEASPATQSAAHLAASASMLVTNPDADASIRRVRRIARRLRRTEDGVRAGLLPASDLLREWRDAYELVRRLEQMPR